MTSAVMNLHRLAAAIAADGVEQVARFAEPQHLVAMFLSIIAASVELREQAIPTDIFILQVAGDWEGIYINGVRVWEHHAADQEALEKSVPNWPKIRHIVDYNAIEGNRCPLVYNPEAVDHA